MTNWYKNIVMVFGSHLKSIEIQGYKSIESGKVDISDISVLIGKNNSGKSNVIDSALSIKELINISPINKLESHWNKYFIGKDNSKPMVISIIYTLPKNFRDTFERNTNIRRRQREQIGGENSLNEIKYETRIDGLSGEERQQTIYLDHNNEWFTINELKSQYNFHLEKGNVQNSIEESIGSWRFVSPFRNPKNEMSAVFMDELRPDGMNLVNVLDSLQSNDRELFEDISTSFVDIMEGISDVSVEYTEVESNKTIMVQEQNYDAKFSAEEISSGSKEILVLLTQIYLAARDADVLFLEEPELHLHPGAERKVYDIIRTFTSTEQLQVIISTHSDVFVNQADASGLTRVDKEGETQLRSIDSDKVDVELRDLGYSKSGLLQAEAVVFVEGRSDKLILPQFAKTAHLDLGESGIKLVELEGESNMLADAKSLVKLLYSFDIPYLFIIDKHDNTIDEARGKLYAAMNRDDDNQWWETSLDSIFVWDAYGIEEYLLTPQAIAAELDLTQDEVKQIIDDHNDIDEKDEVLKKIYAEEYDSVDIPENMYEKGKDGMKIAKRIQADELHNDVQEAIIQIADLVDIEKDELDFSSTSSVNS